MSSTAFVAATAEGKVVVYELNVDKASFPFFERGGVKKLYGNFFGKRGKVRATL